MFTIPPPEMKAGAFLPGRPLKACPKNGPALFAMPARTLLTDYSRQIKKEIFERKYLKEKIKRNTKIADEYVIAINGQPF
jgi:hypothetical protein